MFGVAQLGRSGRIAQRFGLRRRHALFRRLTAAFFGDGITTTQIYVPTSSGTSATISIQIDPLAIIGPRTLTVATGGEFAVAANGFTIVPGSASLQSISQTSGAQGTNATVTLTGSGTHWLQAATSVSFGSGINVGNISNVTPTSLTANISISPGAALGTYTVTATTNGEIVSLPSAFKVVAADALSLRRLACIGPAGPAEPQCQHHRRFHQFQYRTRAHCELRP